MRNADGIRDSRSGYGLAPEPADCLAGGGMMDASVPAFGWAKSPLGPVVPRPRSLRTNGHRVKPINAELIESVVKPPAATPCRDSSDA